MPYLLPTTYCQLLILSLSGIGNYLMHTPFISAVKKQRPDWRLTLWCAPRGQAQLARVNPAIDELIETPLPSPFWQDLSLIIKLRRRRFDAAVMLSPGQRLKGAAFLAAAHIPRRLAHRYPLRRNSTSTFLLTHSISEQENLHDIEQNLALLLLLGLHSPYSPPSIPPSAGTPPTAPPTYSLIIPPNHQTQAQELLTTLKIPINKILIGLHPGSAPNAAFKRWPLERFAVLARALIEKHNAHILIFGGPDEENLKQELQQKIIAPISPVTNYQLTVTLISSNLLTTAALIQRCRLFIGNDSGLMHLAAAAGAPTLGLFGPTDERQVGPRASSAISARAGKSQPVIALRAPGTLAVYNTELNWQLGIQPHSTLQQLPVSLVLSTAIKLLQTVS